MMSAAPEAKLSKGYCLEQCHQVFKHEPVGDISESNKTVPHTVRRGTKPLNFVFYTFVPFTSVDPSGLNCHPLGQPSNTTALGLKVSPGGGFGSHGSGTG